MRYRQLLASIIYATLACGFLTQNAAAESPKPHICLKKQIETILAAPDLARGFWGIEIASAKTGKVLYSLNSTKLFTPASNTKLFTTAAALALIGPDYKFRTTVETNGSLDKYGRLTGDVVIVGRGDPNLTGGTLAYSLRSERNAPRARVLEQLAA